MGIARLARTKWKTILKSVAVSVGISLAVAGIIVVPTGIDSWVKTMRSIDDGTFLAFPDAGSTDDLIGIQSVQLEVLGEVQPGAFVVMRSVSGDVSYDITPSDGVTIESGTSAFVFGPDADLHALTGSTGLAIEVSAPDGTVLYRSPGLPSRAEHPARLTPANLADVGPNGSRVCRAVDASGWKYGSGDLADVAKPANAESAQACFFRSAEALAAAKHETTTWMVQEKTREVAAYALFLLVPATLTVGGVQALRWRLRKATAGDNLGLVDKSKVLPGLGGVVDDLNRSALRAQLSIEQQRSFVADAAHELRSPLAGLLTTLEVAERHPHLVSATEVYRTSLLQAKRLERLTQDLLLLAMVDARTELADDVVDLADVAREVVGELHDPGRPCTVEISGATSVIGDRDSFRRVLQNLVDNAVRHASSEVEVTLLADEQQVRVVVSNDGQPINPADEDRIFHRFTRLDEARTRDGGGAGLGLSIARGLAERYGGRLRVQSGRLDGATFVWEMPIAR